MKNHCTVIVRSGQVSHWGGGGGGGEYSLALQFSYSDYANFDST